MSRTITLKNSEIQSIIINKSNSGYNCTVNYFVLDGDGNQALSQSSHKYTIEADNGSDTLSADSSKLVTDFANSIVANMNVREEL
tara:strand:- start:847 stop:1101 length:255 start_codon:yes stop_codon:yes gene_type:complete